MRHRLSSLHAYLYHHGRDSAYPPWHSWKFVGEEVKTKVDVMVPREVTNVNVELVQISSSPAPLPKDTYDVALVLEET